MAKKQNNNANKSQKTKQVTQQQNKTRALTKNEILFFRIGISVVAIGLVVAAIVMIVTYYMNKADENPYQDYLHFETEELVGMTEKFSDTQYGTPGYFDGKAEFDDFRDIYYDHQVFYFYFYKSDSINEEIKAEIELLEDIETLPLIFIDLNDVGNAALFETPELTHLNLDPNADDMLLIYDMYPETSEDYFNLEKNSSDIISSLGNL